MSSILVSKKISNATFIIQTLIIKAVTVSTIGILNSKVNINPIRTLIEIRISFIIFFESAKSIELFTFFPALYL